MRHFLLLTLIVALAVPTPLLGNVIVKRQAEGTKQGSQFENRNLISMSDSYMFSEAAETTPKPFGNDGFLEEGPLSPQELINTVGGLVRGVFQAFRRIAGTVRNVSSIAQSLVDQMH